MAGSDGPRARLLLRVARQVTGRHDLDAVLIETFRTLHSSLAFEGGCVQLLDDDGWIRLAACDPPVAERNLTRVPLGNSLASRVILTENVLYVANAEEAPSAAFPPSGQTPTAGSYLAVPLLADGRAIGLLQVNSPDVDGFSEDDQTLVLMAGVIVGAAIQNARASVRVSAARRRTEIVEQRLTAVRRLLESASGEPLARSSLPVSQLLDRLGQALSDPSDPADIDLRERSGTSC